MGLTLMPYITVHCSDPVANMIDEPPVGPQKAWI